jgi:hypothetical protein
MIASATITINNSMMVKAQRRPAGRDERRAEGMVKDNWARKNAQNQSNLRYGCGNGIFLTLRGDVAEHNGCAG